MLNKEFIENNFSSKKVLITGHTGFKGSWLSLWLSSRGAIVTGVSHQIPSNLSSFNAYDLKQVIDHRIGDLTNLEFTKSIINEIKPDFIFHLAAQALVGVSYKEPHETISNNVLTTLNILESCREMDFETILVLITSDKVYRNKEWSWGYRENDELGGRDPYSASKGMCELVIDSYSKSFLLEESKIKFAVARAGNVIGGGDWSEGRIVPDIIKSWSQKENLYIRSPNSTRPWQHVLEPLGGYILLAILLQDKDEINGEAFNFGPDNSMNKTVLELSKEFSKFIDNLEINFGTDINIHEAGLLRLSCDKSISMLNWHPRLNFEETVAYTAEWYQSQIKFSNESELMRDFALQQISLYEAVN